MARLTALISLATVIAQCSAHFILNWPVTYGFDDDAEGTAPCGGVSVAYDHNVTEFHVDGDSIAMTSTHPTTTWLFRATVGNNTAANNWNELIPTVNKLVSAISASQLWSRWPPLPMRCRILHYRELQLATPTACKNATGVSASYAADAALSSLPASATATASETSGTAAASSSSTAGALTVGPMEYGVMGTLMWVGSVSVASFAGFLL
ncbi:hypothetical protein DID88_007143 [Monilinia fructigena]|uniref:Copper acquisition factor BIM1-like domain-containing protein n=1 Tax=Monilinia fructigena TaxID=38457 RepID=A0A395J7E2_9HELO|nr:hypothetical protein DID88_007143 [Monilinia fructigena]